MKLTMLRGLPASGKSTLARKLVKESGNAGRINRDDLRAMLFNSEWSGKREGVVVDCEKAIAQVLFEHKMRPVVDDTNLSEKHRQMWSEFSRGLGNEFDSCSLDVDIPTCIVRDPDEKSILTPEQRKQFAIYATAKKPVTPILFAMLDGKDYGPIIWKMVKPQAEQVFKTDEEG